MGKLKWIFFVLILISGTLMVNCNKMDALEEMSDLKKDTVMTDLPKDTSKTGAVKDTGKIDVIKDTTNVGVIKDTSLVVIKDTSKIIVVVKDTSKIIVVIKDTVSTKPPQVQAKGVNIIFDGDSQTKRGYYPAKICELLKLKGYTQVKSINFAVSGQYISQLVSDVSTQIVPKYDKTMSKNIVCLWIGGNDATKDALTDTAKLYRYLLTYYKALNKAGFKVVLINLPDARRHIGINIINAMYNRVHPKICDAYVNCRKPGGVFEDVTNTLYYSDAAGHLSITGYYYMAEKYVYPKLIELLNK